MRVYHGSCECEKVKYEAAFDLSRGTFKCNCRMCTKSRLWAALVDAENVKLVSGESELIRYGENPLHHFCGNCGVKTFGKVEMPDGKKFFAVMLATLDDLDPKDWAKSPVRYHDGLHDRFDREPEFVGHL